MRIVIALLLLTRLAHADVGVVVSGEPTMQATLMTHVQGWLQTREYPLVAVPLGTAANSFIDCFVMDDMACAKRTFEAEAKATSIVFARADLMTGKDYNVTLYWFLKGHEPAVQKAPCKNCDDGQFAAIVATLMGSLEKTVSQVNGKLKITSGIVGVMVAVDNIALGPAPIEKELTAGPHQVAFSHGGKVIETRPVRIEPAATLEVAPPTVPLDSAEPKQKKSKTVPTALVIGGAALAIVGGVFLYYGALGGPDEPFVYDNATEIGVPFTVAGAAGVIGGVIWAGTF